MISVWTNASPASKKSVYIMAFIFVILIVIVPTVWHQNTTTAQNRMNAAVVSDDSDLNAYRLNVEIKLSIVNTDDFSYSLILKPTPHGDLASQGNDSITRYKTLVILSVKGQSYTLQKWSPSAPIEYKTNFLSGTSNSYPLDRYADEFDMSAAIYLNGSYESIKIRTDYTGTFDTYDVSADVKTYSSKSTFRLEISRTGTTKFFSISVIFLMWLLSFTILTLSVTIWVRKRVVEPPTIAVAAGLLFAIPQLRNVQPGIPPIGCAADTLSFFWCMALIASSLLLLMWNYIINKKEKSLSPYGSAAFLKMQKHPSDSSHY